MNRKVTVFLSLISLVLLLLSACSAASTSSTRPFPDAPESIPATSSSPSFLESAPCTHQFGEWQTAKEATCKEEGRAIQICTLCKEENAQSIPKVLEHAFMADGLCKICQEPMNAGFVFEENGDGESYSFSYKGEGTTVTVPSAFNDMPVTRIKSVKDHVKRVILPDSIIEIGPYAFFLCDEMTYINFPKKLSIIGTYAFDGCSALSSVTLPSSVTFVGERAFANCSFSSLTLNEGLVTIGDYAFDTCANVSTLWIPSTVETIGEGAFQSFGALKNLTFKENSALKSIGAHAFSSGAELKEVLLPEGLLTIGEAAFRRREGLVSVGIPSTIKSFGKEAFKGLTNVVFTFNGSEEQWNAIKKGENWDAQCEEYSVVFKETEA